MDPRADRARAPRQTGADPNATARGTEPDTRARRPAHLHQARRPDRRGVRRQQAAQPGIPFGPHHRGASRHRGGRSGPSVQLGTPDGWRLQQAGPEDHPGAGGRQARCGAGQPAGGLPAWRRGGVRADPRGAARGARRTCAACPRGRWPTAHPQRQPDVRCRFGAGLSGDHAGAAGTVGAAQRAAERALHVVQRQGAGGSGPRQASDQCGPCGRGRHRDRRIPCAVTHRNDCQ